MTQIVAWWHLVWTESALLGWRRLWSRWLTITVVAGLVAAQEPPFMRWFEFDFYWSTMMPWLLALIVFDAVQWLLVQPDHPPRSTWNMPSQMAAACLGQALAALSLVVPAWIATYAIYCIQAEPSPSATAALRALSVLTMAQAAILPGLAAAVSRPWRAPFLIALWLASSVLSAPFPLGHLLATGTLGSSVWIASSILASFAVSCSLRGLTTLRN